MEQFIKIDNNILEYNLYNLPQLVLEVTDKCNLRCAYCAFSDLYDNRRCHSAGDMTFDMAKVIIDYLVETWNKYSNVYMPKRFNIGFYGGEPTLNFQLISDVVNYIEKIKCNINREITYSMTTNGLLLHKYMDYFQKHNFSLLISLDGDEKANSYRVDTLGNPVFERVVHNIRLLQNKYPEYYHNKVGFNSVLNNRSTASSVNNYISDTFGKIPNISPMTDSYVNKNMLDKFKEISSTCIDIDSLTIERNEDTSTYAINGFYKYFSRLSGNIFYDYNDLFLDKELFGVIPTGTCIPFAKKMFVTTQGKILQCERINHKYFLGYIGDGIVNIDFKKIAKKFNQINHKFIKQCSSCIFIKHCPRCMYRLNDTVNENRCLSYRCKSSEKLSLERYRNGIDFLLDSVYKVKIIK